MILFILLFMVLLCILAEISNDLALMVLFFAFAYLMLH